ncbi:Metallo-dependent phosphatase [Auricularia subglabra TFB-10046 SS5]|nr:Metallo-dependent phosphatase [Auricularia subglabra TFB-10046 SS5]
MKGKVAFEILELEDYATRVPESRTRCSFPATLGPRLFRAPSTRRRAGNSPDPGLPVPTSWRSPATATFVPYAPMPSLRRLRLASTGVTVLVLLAVVWAAGYTADGVYDVTLIHVNDVHAHLDQFQPSGMDCDPKHECVGGYARLKTKIDELRAKDPSALLLNAGDEFQGTLFYSYYNSTGEKIAETINQLGFDAFVLGNHEFDEGDDTLGAFLKNLTFPLLSANLRTRNPSLLAANIRPYTIHDAHKLAIIGLTTPDTIGTSSPGPTTRFDDPFTILEDTLSSIRSAHPDINRVVALSHLGYDEDIELAQNSAGVGVILGGHSHTLVGDMPGAKGPYPTVVKNRRGEDVLVCTAFKWGEYLGRLDVGFDTRGRVVRWNGEPIRMTKDIAPDAHLHSQILEWRRPFDAFGRTVVGHVTAPLSDKCHSRECAFGNLVADVLADYGRALAAPADIESLVEARKAVDGALVNAGGIRTPLAKGEVRRKDIMNALPFANTVVVLDVTGQELWNVFSAMVNRRTMDGQRIETFLQVSADFQVRYDMARQVGERLRRLRLGGDDVVLHRRYAIAANDFLAAGGDFFFPNSTRTGPPLAAVDELVVKYLQAHDPYTPPRVGRRLVGGDADGGTGDDGFPVEDASWSALAMIASAMTVFVLWLEWVRVRGRERI